MLEEGNRKDSFKRDNLSTVLSVFIVLITFTGIAVAAYTWNYTSTHAGTIGTGNISMSFLESTDMINLSNTLPISDSQGIAISKDKAYDFAVTTNANGAPGNINYKILLKKEPVNEGYVSLPDNSIKVYLTKFDSNGEVEVMAPTLVSNIITSGDEGTLKFNKDKMSYLIHSHYSNKDTKTTKYRLRMWIDSNTSASDFNLKKYEYKLKIGVTGSLSV